MTGRKGEREIERHPSLSTHSDVLRVLRAPCPRPRRVRSLDSPHQELPLVHPLPLGSFRLPAPPLGPTTRHRHLHHYHHHHHHPALPPPRAGLSFKRSPPGGISVQTRDRNAARAWRATKVPSVKAATWERTHSAGWWKRCGKCESESHRLLPLSPCTGTPYLGRRPRSSSAPTASARVPFCSGLSRARILRPRHVRYVRVADTPPVGDQTQPGGEDRSNSSGGEQKVPTSLT